MWTLNFLLAAVAAGPVAAPASGGSSAPRPASSSPATETDHGKLPWFTGTFEELLAKAKAENKPIFIDFWADWCIWCKRLVTDTFNDDLVVAEMKDFYVINIDTESKAGKPIAERFKVEGLPTLLFLNPDGSVRDVIVGYKKPGEFKVEVQRIRADRDTIADLKRQIEKSPSDIDVRLKYAAKLKDLNDTVAYEAQIDEILKLDPERKDKRTGELVYGRLMAKVKTLWEAEKFDEIPALIEGAMATEKDPELLFNGWYTLASIHDELGARALKAKDAELAEKHRAGSLKAKRAALPNVPEKHLVRFCNELGWTLYETRTERSAEEKAFGLEIARKLHPKAEAAKDPNALDTVACLYQWNGLRDEALAVLRKAIEIDPDNEEFDKRLREFEGEKS